MGYGWFLWQEAWDATDDADLSLLALELRWEPIVQKLARV